MSEVEDDVIESGEESSSESSDTSSNTSSDTSSNTSSDTSSEGGDALEEFDGLDELDEDELNTHHIIDWGDTLRSRLEELSNSIAQKNITLEEYGREMLRNNYWNFIKTKTFIISDEDQDIINKLRSKIEELKIAYNNRQITEDIFNTKYDEFLRMEYNILKVSESSSSSSKKHFIDPTLDIEQKLESLHKEEVKHMKKIARKHNIIPPEIPSGYSEDDIQNYYNKLITDDTLEFDPEIDNYIKAYNTYKQKVDSHSPSYVLTERSWGSDEDAKASEPNYKFKMIKPLAIKISELKTTEGRFNLLSERERIDFQTDMWKDLVKDLRKLSKKELLSCIPNRTYNYMSYIERLRENKQKMIKFREHPTNYEELKNILVEDSKYYRVEVNKFFKNYSYSRPYIYDTINRGRQARQVKGLAPNSRRLITVSPSMYLQDGNINYLAFKAGSDRKNLGDISNFVTVKPIDDELFVEISNREGNSTSIIDVWELRVSLAEVTAFSKEKIGIVKRYESFNEYLSDFKDILLENLKKVPPLSQNVLKDKIRKINHYLNTGEDPDIHTQTGQLPISDMFNRSDEITEIRKNGRTLLLENISEYIEHDPDRIDDLEKYTFDFSSSNYLYNIKKIIWVFDNYPDTLKSFRDGKLSNLELLSIETTRVTPVNDLSGIKTGQDKIDYLLQWRPDTYNYDRYASEINLSNDIEKFKRDNTNISLLKIEEIFSEYSENLQWNNTISDYETLDIIPIRERLYWLIKQRNKLPSRRIYRIATLSDRIKSQEDIEYIFNICEIVNKKQYARITETIIYKISKSVEEYVSNTEFIKREYSVLCKYLSEFNISTEKKDWEIIDPFLLTPVITEFLLTNGNFSSVDKTRLDSFISNSNITDNAILSYIKSLRGDEIDIYDSILIDEVNENMQNFIKKRSLNKILNQVRKIKTNKILEKELENKISLEQNTYITPKISSVIPVPDAISRGGINFIPDYIELNGFYISGGNYPNYETPGRKGEETIINYTRGNLIQLAGIFSVPEVNDSYQLYRDIINKKSLLENRSAEEIIIPEYIPGNGRGQGASDYYENLKLPEKKYKYTYRPRLGVKEPGEVYGVVKDLDKKYGIPFTYANGIPIYSLDLKPLVDDSYVIIEGPAIYQKEESYFSSGRSMSSEYYILIEYLDSRGKSKMFREGVSEKRIETRSIDYLDTCDRFQSEDSCNDPNSYSLDIKGEKLRCNWVNPGKCISKSGPDLNSDLILSEIDFSDETLNKEWKIALEKSMNSIENYIKDNKLKSDKIDEITSIEKNILYDYYLKLLDVNEEKNTHDSLIVSVPLNSSTNVKIPIDVLGRELPGSSGVINNIATRQTWLNENYDTITIYNLVPKFKKYPIMNIEIGKEYIIDDIKLIPLEYIKETDSYICNKVESDDEISLPKSQFKISGNKLTFMKESTFCYISKEDNLLLADYPGYYWSISNVSYDERVMNEIIVKNTEIEYKTFVPTSLIKPTPGVLLNGNPLITRDDILKAIYETAYSELETQDNYIYQVKTPASFATSAAIKFSLTNGVDLNGEIKTRYAFITLSDVIEEYERLFPKPIMSKKQLTDILEKAVEDNDYDKAAQYYYRGRLNNLPKELLKDVKIVIDNKPKEPEKEIKLPTVPDIKTSSVKNSLVVSRRRPRR